MKLNRTVTKSDIIYYLARSVRKNGKVTSVNVKTLGKHSELLRLHDDPEAYCRELVVQANEELKSNLCSITQDIDFNSILDGESNASSSPTYKNIGYLYLNDIFNKLKIPECLKALTSGRKTKYSVSDALKLLVFSRILDPHSKKSTFDSSSTYLKDFDLSLDDIYRSLDVIDELSCDLQRHIYKASGSLYKSNGSVLYYDCTNYYFETEQEDEDVLRKYGVSKEHRPNPIVQMGLFIDENGMPIAFDVLSGNTNGQVTAVPLEKRIVKDYQKAKFIYFSDAGLSSEAIKRFNSFGSRAYIVTQSLKKLPKEEQELIFKDVNWKCLSDNKMASLNEYKTIAGKLLSGANLTEEERKAVGCDLIYKDYPYKNERLIVTFSLRSYVYQRSVFNKQLERADAKISKNSITYQAQDVRRLIEISGVTAEGEMADNTVLSLNDRQVEKERKYHGFYACATNLEDDVGSIIETNKARWKIEDCFRIMKTTFKARPVYLQKDNHIKAHFFTCYLALHIFTLLKLKLKRSYSNDNLVKTLRNMNIAIDEKTNIGKALYTNSEILASLEEEYRLGLNHKYYRMGALRKKAK